MKSVPSKSLESALRHVQKGGKLVVRTCTHITVIDKKCVARFEKAGHWILKEEGDGYRMRTGKKSVYLLPGQLEFA